MPAKSQTSKDDLKDMLGHIGKDVDADTVFGETRVIEGRAVIPVASVSYGGGGGAGQGGDETGDEGEGMGLGFGLQAKPLGVIEVTADQVRWVPVVDVAKVVMVCVIGGVLAGVLGSIAGGGCRRG
jgi:uncharacterized spore protein YtfJ